MVSSEGSRRIGNMAYFPLTSPRPRATSQIDIPALGSPVYHAISTFTVTRKLTTVYAFRAHSLHSSSAKLCLEQSKPAFTRGIFAIFPVVLSPQKTINGTMVPKRSTGKRCTSVEQSFPLFHLHRPESVPYYW